MGCGASAERRACVKQADPAEFRNTSQEHENRPPAAESAPSRSPPEALKASQTTTLEDAATLEADKAAAAKCENRIHRAAQIGSVPALRHLLKRSPESLEAPHPTDGFGQRPLHFATNHGRIDAVQLLLARRADVEAKTNIGQTPLHSAAYHGHLQVVECLIAAGAEVDAMANGETPLRYAAAGGHLQVVERLIAAGAAVDAAADGQTAYDIAQHRGHRQVMGALRPVSVALLSGRSCNCSSLKDRTLMELKEEAGQKLGLKIKSLIGPDHQALDETRTLEELEIQPGFTLTAIVQAAGNEVEHDEIEDSSSTVASGSAGASGEARGEAPAEGMLQDPRAFINFLLSAEIRLVRLEFLLELNEGGVAMPRRQEAEKMRSKSGATALVELEEYKRLHVNETTGHVSIHGSGGQMTTVSFRSVSHMWEGMQHPDPWGFQLDLIAQKYGALGGCGIVWIFLDFMSLHQYKRSVSEDLIFKRALDNMHLLYSHEIVVVDILKELTPESWKSDRLIPAYDETTDSVIATPIARLKLNNTPHSQRGWCQAEQEWARLRNMLEGMGIPTPPEIFQNRMGKLIFTHRNDAPQVVELQREVFHHKVRGTTHLHLENLRAEDLETLREALPHYTRLKYIVANGNVIGGADAVALIQSGAVDIQLDSCLLTDDDAEAMAEALMSSVTLTSLSICGNCISQRGRDALGKAMELRPQLNVEPGPAMCLSGVCCFVNVPTAPRN